MSTPKEGASIFAQPVPYNWLTASVCCYILFAWTYLFFGGGYLNDESLYALSARNVLEGLKPYHDFGFTQMPLLAYWYAIWFSLTGTSIEAGRVLSASMGAGSVVLIALAAYRRAGTVACAFSALLIGCNLHFIGDTLGIKTQSLTVFLTACSIFVLSKRESPKPVSQAGLAMFFMTLALLGRLSVLPALLLLWVYLGWKMRSRFGAFVVLWLANVAILGGVYAFFRADGNMFYWVVQVHSEIAGFAPWTWERLLPTIHSWLGNELPIILLFFAAMWVFAAKWLEDKNRFDNEELLFAGFLVLSYWGATAIHWTNVLSYATHQTSMIAFPVVFAAVVLAPRIEQLLAQDRGLWAFAFAALLWLTPPLGEIGMDLSIDRRGNLALQSIENANAIIARYAQKGDSILSFSSELAINGGYKVPRGYEMREFGYFPGKSDEDCAKLHAVNFKKLAQDIDSGQHKILTLEDRLFSIMAAGNQEMANQLKQLIDKHYHQVAVVQNYGQFRLNLYIFVLAQGS